MLAGLWRLTSFTSGSSHQEDDERTAPSLIDALPDDLLPSILAHVSSPADLFSCASVCSALSRVVTDAQYDALLWQKMCIERWRTKAYDPLQVFPHALTNLCHRQRFQWAERDGSRQLGTGEDLCAVEEWEVKFFRAEPYRCVDLFSPRSPRPPTSADHCPYALVCQDRTLPV